MNPYAYPNSTSNQRSAPLPGFWGIILNTASLYGEVLLRSNFGERHLTFVRVLLAMIGLLFLPMFVVAVFTFFLGNFLLGSMGGLAAALFSSQFMPQPTVFFHGFVLLFLIKSCWHFIEMEYRRKAGEQVVSTYSGRPNALWKLIPGFGEKEDLVKRFAEPVALLLFALWLRQSDFILCLYLCGAALAMFTRGHFEHLVVNQRLYDLHDQMLEGQALGGTLRGQSNQPGDLKGVAMPAMLDGYAPHQADVLASTLHAQSPLSPLLPGPLPLPPNHPAAGLAPEYARLLTLPEPEEPPLEDWFTEEPPPLDDWFMPVPVVDSVPAHPTEPQTDGRRVHLHCPNCRVQLDAPRVLKQGRPVRCKACQHRFVLDKSIRCFRIRRNPGVKHAA